MIVVGFPILLMLLVLVIFGVTWLFHHHHWRPFAGLFLLVAGLVCLWTLVRYSATSVTEQLPRSVGPAWGTEWKIESRGVQSRPTQAIPTKGDNVTKEDIVPKAQLTAETLASSAERTAEKPDDHTLAAPSGNTSSPTVGNTKGADKKPAWVGQPLHRSEYDGQQVSLASAASGPYTTTDECERAIIPAINEIVARYVRKDERLAELSDTDLALDANYIREYLVKQWYTETVEASVGQMYQLHALVVFDDRVQRELESLVGTARVAGRLKYAAAGTVITLLLLGGVYSILKKGAGRAATAAK